MGLSHEIQRRIRNKEAEIVNIERDILQLRMKLESAKAYIQGLQEILPKAEREDESGGVFSKGGGKIRPGTLVARARNAIAASGKAMHITELLVAMGKENNERNRLSLVGSLGRCVREGLVFTRPAPNTFGLISMPDVQKPNQEELPDGFGK